MTTKRETSKPFDLDAAKAARREAEGEPFTFLWQGESYTALPAKEWPITVAGALSTGDLTTAVTLILGEQGEAFLATNPAMGDVEALMDALAAFSGVSTSGE